MIHLYALTDDPPAVGGLTGVDDALLRVMDAGDLHAVISEHDQPPRATRDRALAHAAATLAVCRIGHAAPVRYGAQHADEAALRAALDERAARLRASVDRVAGHLEVVVRFDGDVAPVEPVTASADAASPDDPAEQSVPAGRAYLEDRLRQQRAEEAVRLHAADALREATAALDAWAAEVTEHDGPQGPERCLLVVTKDADAVAAAAQELAGEDHRIVVGGPWPPYTFV